MSMMLFKSIRIQMEIISEKKGVVFLFFGLIILVLMNYLKNVFTYAGTDLVEMYHPMKLLVLSSYGAYGYYLMQCYPLLVIIPAGFSYFVDNSSREKVLIQARVGVKNYYYGKLISVFMITFCNYSA